MLQGGTSPSLLFLGIYLGERSALCYHTDNRKRKSKKRFSHQILTQDPSND